MPKEPRKAFRRRLQELGSPNADTRSMAADALGKMGHREAAQSLHIALADGESKVRRAAARALGQIGAVEAVEALCRLALKDPSYRVRRSAAQALGRLGQPAAVAVLCQTARDEKAIVRGQAIWALGQIGDAAGIETVFAALQDRREAVRQMAQWSLSRFGPAMVAFLCRQLEPAAPPQRELAASALVILHHALLRDRGSGRLARFVPYEILGAAELNAKQRWLALEILSQAQKNAWWNVWGTQVLPPYAFCERLVKREAARHPESVLSGARQVLDYLTLARPSARDLTVERETLLRATQRAALPIDPDSLLRAAEERPETDMPEETTGLSLSFFDRVKQWFRR